MISARSERSDLTDFLLEGENIDIDIQENVRLLILQLVSFTYWSCVVCHACCYGPSN